MAITHSIIIPTHNRREKLKRAVISASVAAGSSGEVIVVDDASEIPAEQVLSDMSFSRLRIYRSDKPMRGGGSPARNIGALNAKGRVLFFLDDDDTLLSEYCASVLESSVQECADFGFSARAFVADKIGKPNERIELRRLAEGVISEKARFADKTFPFSAGFWLKSSTYEHVGPMEDGLRTNSDTEYCCRLFKSGLRGWYSSVPGVRIHEHDTQTSGDVINVTKRTRAEHRAKAFATIAAKHADYLRHDVSAGQFIYGRLAKHAARAGDRDQALCALRQLEPWTERVRVRMVLLPLLMRYRRIDVR